MYLVQETPGEPIASVDELREYFQSACKPKEDWRFGTEHELHGVRVAEGQVGEPLPYEGPAGVGAVLAALAERGWAPVQEGEHIIALSEGQAQVTIEPGGQLELAARPVAHADEMKADLCAYLGELDEPSRRLEVAWLGMGFRPFGRIEDVSWMPKWRYDVMREYMPLVGTRGHEMMKRTATVQVNIDFGDADDAMAKMRGVMSVTSLLTAIYASSPIVDGALTDYQSYRAYIWRDTDRERSGLLPFVFEDGDVFGDYVQWALDVPMYFVYRGGYQPAERMTFRQFLTSGWRGHHATLDDWALHLSTLFPEARLKRYLEIRGCDGGTFGMILALAPLSRALLYDRDACDAAAKLTAGLRFEERIELADAIPMQGFAARVGSTGHTVGELAKELMQIARASLQRQMPSELGYLEPLHEIVESGRTHADRLADIWRRENGDPRRVIEAVCEAGKIDCGR